MRLVTVATHADGYFTYLKLSCERHKADLTILGWGQRWRGWMWRANLLLDFVSSCPPDEVVCVIDAYDVILLQPTATLESRFRRLSPSGDVVISTDVAQMTTRELYGTLFFGSCYGHRISSGAYAGTAQKLRALLMRVLSYSGRKDDQVAMTFLCRTVPGIVKIDVKHDLFLTVANHELPLDLDDAGIRIRDGVLEVQGARPCVLHVPAATRIDHVLDALGYPAAIHRGFKDPMWMLVAKCIALVVAVAAATVWLRRNVRCKRV